jgi:TRAP-type C4-dicarboxylate transport system permease small subunit
MRETPPGRPGAAGEAVPADLRVRPGALGLVDRPVLALAVLAGFLAAAMMLLTVIDVAGRNLLNQPLLGAFEATELLMAAIVFLALPLVTWRREHVTVTLLYERLPARTQSVLPALGELVAAAVCGVLSWRAWLYGERLLGAGERTLELGVPRGYVPAGVAIVLGLVALTFLLLAFRALLLGERTPT